MCHPEYEVKRWLQLRNFLLCLAHSLSQHQCRMIPVQDGWARLFCWCYRCNQSDAKHVRPGTEEVIQLETHQQDQCLTVFFTPAQSSPAAEKADG